MLIYLPQNKRKIHAILIFEALAHGYVQQHWHWNFRMSAFELRSRLVSHCGSCLNEFSEEILF